MDWTRYANPLSNPRRRGLGLYSEIAVQEGDLVIYRDHRDRYRVDRITSNRGHHVTIGSTRGMESLREAIRTAEQEAHRQGDHAVAVAGGPPGHVQIGSIVDGRFRYGGDDTLASISRFV